MISKTMADKVWRKAKKIYGKDPDKYRQDPYGKTMYKNSRGKPSIMGWDVDHIKPKSKGGSDNLINLQALNTKKNRSKGNSLIKKSRHSKSNQ
jgi:5-methylcytosine-specific restriction endonuclease McrA